MDKTSGLFSRTAGGRVARIFGQRTAGHIGTLDPMATGVLPIAIGSATKIIPFVEDMPGADEKEYDFSMQFGVATDTLDITGRQTQRNDFVPAESDVIAILDKFIGEIDQIPPQYSAVHVSGRRAYEIARGGAVADIRPRRIRIMYLKFTGRHGTSWHFHVKCGRGTYVRALARDIATNVGAIATVDMIRRTRTGAFDLKNAVQLDFLENLVNNGDDVSKYLMSTDSVLGDIPVMNLNDKSANLYRNGGFIETDANNGLMRVYSGDVFIGIGCVLDGILRPKRTII
ncbi:MAG: tRNA pseudouridine(55) synthase TruB [Muribaculaceae bacterium]|nr:tRNA pseudouridine(55) synthase TruB [Muribaculaceae bacterium]